MRAFCFLMLSLTMCVSWNAGKVRSQTQPPMNSPTAKEKTEEVDFTGYNTHYSSPGRECRPATCTGDATYTISEGSNQGLVIMCRLEPVGTDTFGLCFPGGGPTEKCEWTPGTASNTVQGTICSGKQVDPTNSANVTKFACQSTYYNCYGTFRPLAKTADSLSR
jgi:hypothetical protein